MVSAIDERLHTSKRLVLLTAPRQISRSGLAMWLYQFRDVLGSIRLGCLAQTINFRHVIDKQRIKQRSTQTLLSILNTSMILYGVVTNELMRSKRWVVRW